MSESMLGFLDDPKNKKLFEEMVSRSNYKIIEDVLNIRLFGFCKKLMSIYMELNPDWRNILAKGEIEESNTPSGRRIRGDDKYCPFLIFGNKGNLKRFINESDLDPLNPSTFHKESGEFGPFDMNDFDLAGLVNILQKRFFKGPYGTNNDRIQTLCKTIRSFRKLINHSKTGAENLANDCSKYPKFYRPSNRRYMLKADGDNCDFDELYNKAAAVSNDDRLDERYKSAAAELLDDLRLFKKTEDLIKDGTAIDWAYRSKIRSDYLVGYNVFFTATALTSDDSAIAFFKTVCMLTSKLNNNKYTNGKTKYGICIFKNEYEALKYSPGKNGRGKRYSAIISDYSDLIRVIDADSQNIEDFFRDKKDKYCIFTAYDLTARRIRELGKPNVIAAHIEDSTFFRVYSEDLGNIEISGKRITAQNSVGLSENAFYLQKIESMLSELKSLEAEGGIPESAFKKPDEVPETGSPISIVYSNGGGSEKTKLGEEAAKPGGEGWIFKCPDNDNEVIKIYREDKWNVNTFDKLAAMKDIPLATKKELRANNICWPIDLVLYKNRLVGFTMRKVPDGAKTVEELLQALKAGSNEWKLQRRDLVKICQKIIEGFIFIHSKGIIMGDVNLKNIMITSPNSDRSLEVYFIDVDSYQYSDFRCTAGVEDFASPRIIEAQMESGKGFSIERTLEDELYAEIMLVFMILFINDYPFRNDKNTAKLKLEGRFRFAEDRKKREEFAKDRYDKIWANLSAGMQTMFDEVFSGRKIEKYSEEKIIELLGDYFDLIEPAISDYAKKGAKADRGLSNQIKPTGDPKGSKWEKVECRSCHRDFWRTENSTDKSSTCPDCLQIKDTEEAEVFECVCSKCRKPFKINKYVLRDTKDYLTGAGKLSDKILCYNCNTSLHLPSMEKTDYLNYALEKYYSYRELTGSRIPTGASKEEDNEP